MTSEMWSSLLLVAVWAQTGQSARLSDGNVTVGHGHYPYAHCTARNVMLDTSAETFYYHSHKDLHSVCRDSNAVWNIQNTGTPIDRTACDEHYDTGYTFTIFYFYKTSNNFHLHFDMMLPLYNDIYFDSDDHKHDRLLFMPCIESSRLKKCKWDTDGFSDDKFWWMEVVKIITGRHKMMPLGPVQKKSGKKICFKRVEFGAIKYNYKDADLVLSYSDYVKQSLGIEIHDPPTLPHRIGFISRKGRRKVLNEPELVKAVAHLAPMELVEFSGMSFQAQVHRVQRYSVLIGVNGAGLANALYLPRGAVAVQLVPYQANVNFNEFGQMLKGRGPYLEWHNKHEENTRRQPHDANNNNPDTVVHVEEFVALVTEAMQMAGLNVHGTKEEL